MNGNRNNERRNQGRFNRRDRNRGGGDGRGQPSNYRGGYRGYHRGRKRDNRHRDRRSNDRGPGSSRGEIRMMGDRIMVLPGEVLSPEGLRGGECTFTAQGSVVSTNLGIKATYRDNVSVIPLTGRYFPMKGDEVIGKVISVMANQWIVDINSPYNGPLHSADTNWDIGYGGTDKYLTLGDLILVRVQSVDMLMRFDLSMIGRGLKKLSGGNMVEVSHNKVRRIIGKSGSMIKLLKDRTGCFIHVGQNGRIWLDGDVEMIQLAVEAIGMIEEKAHVVGLTQKVQEFLEHRLALSRGPKKGVGDPDDQGDDIPDGSDDNGG